MAGTCKVFKGSKDRDRRHQCSGTRFRAADLWLVLSMSWGAAVIGPGCGRESRADTPSSAAVAVQERSASADSQRSPGIDVPAGESSAVTDDASRPQADVRPARAEVFTPVKTNRANSRRKPIRLTPMDREDGFCATTYTECASGSVRRCKGATYTLPCGARGQVPTGLWVNCVCD